MAGAFLRPRRVAKSSRAPDPWGLVRPLGPKSGKEGGTGGAVARAVHAPGKTGRALYSVRVAEENEFLESHLLSPRFNEMQVVLNHINRLLQFIGGPGAQPHAQVVQVKHMEVFAERLHHAVEGGARPSEPVVPCRGSDCE